MAAPDTLLARASHCQLAYGVSDGVAMTPMAYWSDGGGLWMTSSRRAAKIAALRRDGRCAVWIAPPDPSEPGVAVDGRARVYDLSDPVGVALHWPAISGALAGLALRHRSALTGYVQDLPGLPSAWLPHNRVLLRVRIDAARGRLAPQRVEGVGPLLPPVLPSGVRRALTGVRRVTLATLDADRIVVRPAVWGTDFRLDVSATAIPAPDTPACVVADSAPSARPSAKTGVLLRGTLGPDLRLHPTRAVWWEGFSLDAAPVDLADRSSAIVLPD